MCKSTLLGEEVWKELKSGKGERDLKLKKNMRRFVSFGTKGHLDCIARSKIKIKAVVGAVIQQENGIYDKGSQGVFARKS